MPRGVRKPVGVYIAKTTGFCEIDGKVEQFFRGVTRVQEGHPLLASAGDCFELASERMHYATETAAVAASGARVEDDEAE